MKYIVVLVALLLLSEIQAQKKICRGLAMSGAGSLGAYQAAVIMGLTNYEPNPEEELSWDVVTGVSAGSLNALAMGGYAPEDVNEAADFIYALWNSIPDYEAYGNWPGGILEGLFFKGGIFDISPGVQWVTEQWGDNTVNRKVSFAWTESRTGQYVVYDYNATGTTPSDYIQMAFASSSIPGFFPAVNVGNRTLVDGGSIWNLDVSSAVRRCREVVDDDKDIVLDFILIGDTDIPAPSDLSKYRTLDHLLRGKLIKSYYNCMSDYESSKVLYPDVTFRYIIAPSEDISTGPLPLDFSRAQVDLAYAVGDKDAYNAVQLGPGGYGDVLLAYYKKRLNNENVKLKDMINEKLAEIEKKKLASE